MSRVPFIERAYQMSASGSFQSTEDIRRALKAEGYEQVDAHFASTSLQKQLKTAMRSATKPDDKG